MNRPTLRFGKEFYEILQCGKHCLRNPLRAMLPSQWVSYKRPDNILTEPLRRAFKLGSTFKMAENDKIKAARTA
jgi:hypothetical protein